MNDICKEISDTARTKPTVIRLLFKLSPEYRRAENILDALLRNTPEAYKKWPSAYKTSNRDFSLYPEVRSFLFLF